MVHGLWLWVKTHLSVQKNFNLWLRDSALLLLGVPLKQLPSGAFWPSFSENKDAPLHYAAVHPAVAVCHGTTWIRYLRLM